MTAIGITLRQGDFASQVQSKATTFELPSNGKWVKTVTGVLLTEFSGYWHHVYLLKRLLNSVSQVIQGVVFVSVNIIVFIPVDLKRISYVTISTLPNSSRLDLEPSKRRSPLATADGYSWFRDETRETFTHLIAIRLEWKQLKI